MKFTSKDVSAMLEELVSHDDVVGHCSSWYGYYNSSVCLEDNGTTEDRSR